MQIQYDGIKHTYRSPAGEPRTVLDIPEWSLQPGEQVLLRGVSGSGKTTLFNITAGLMRPTEGKVCFGEQSLYALPEAARDKFRSRNVGYIFQNHYLVNALTALENVEMPMAFVNDMPRKKRRAIASEVLAKVGLADHIHYRPEQMSTGQRLRVGIARALANNPAVLLADEPTAALDPENAAQAMELIQESCKQNNAILIVSSHDPAITPRFERIANLDNGKLSIEERQTT